MDVNANLLPTALPANTAKNANSQKNETHTDENQATALPFQAVLESQQPAPKNTQADASTKTPNDENGLNKQIVSDKLAESKIEATSQPPITKESAENTLDQLNFSRNLRADNGLAIDSTQTALKAELLTGKQEGEQAWQDNLKLSLTDRMQTTSTTTITTDKQTTLGVFTQKMQPLNDDIQNASQTDGKHLIGSQLELADEEKAPTLGVFIKNEKDERRDQPLFSLDNHRDITTKKLTEDFAPLNKKVVDKEPLSNLQTIVSDSINSGAKGAFTIQSETGAFASSQTHQATTQAISMMPTQSTAQAAAMNAPMAPPTLHLNSQLGSEAWQQQLSQHMLFFSRQGISQAQIRLHPEELGSLNVHLRIEDNQAVMHFVSPHSHVRAIMESMMPVLRSALQESGINLAQGSVGQDNFNQQSDSQQQNATHHDGKITATHSTAGAVGISEANTINSVNNNTARQGGINTFA
ncbi:MAG TPA: flagellar hook-length control protein FliK [Providencia sp.]|uniref:flagellar hook-length control protein FliK n=1 Tax=Providencia sp. TaxID=589 RepID=UPI000E936E09|nr:flagellar hook-length control protein FliK [Providencia sp.]MBP6079683.1 flagellar hook-length control protein FliK [Providencia sp.]HBO23917.1 flagellar hook-length control protein FliK [Providencia sp.]